MPPPPPPLAHCLPALSVVLGLPLLAVCQNDINGRRRRRRLLASTVGVGDVVDGRRDTPQHLHSAIIPAFSSALPTVAATSADSSDTALPFNGKDSPSTTTSTTTTTVPSRNSDHELLFSRRVQSNISRIYARRIINKARLERQHPWWRGEEEDVTTACSSINNNNTRASTMREGVSGTTSTTSSSWKNNLLSETLLSLIKLQEKMEKFQSFSNSSSSLSADYFTTTAHGKWLLDLLDQPQLRPASSTLMMVAQCESNAKQRTLDTYNALSSSTVMASSSSRWGGSNSNSSSSNTSKDKPAEWNDDIDLVQKRHEFGQQISPLSHTTRFQRWGMALKRIATLSMLVAPLGVLVPLNYIVGNVAAGGGDGGSDVAVDDEEGSNTTTDERGMEPTAPPEQLQARQPPPPPSALQQYHQRLSTLTWDYALWAIETAGPTYIKLVQWASTRHDLFSPEFVSHFTKLQDETRGHSWKETEMTLVRSFGKDWRNVLSFDKVIDDGISMEEDGGETDGIEGGRLKRTGGAANRERQKRLFSSTSATTTPSSSSSSSSSVPTIPIGSGCVAQVYKARLTTHHGLHPPGTSVAVKVQHPRILEKVCLDFYILNKVASFLEYIPYLNLDYLSMKDSVDQFRDIMLPQLDLRVEAHNLQRFRRDFEGDTQIAFPEPFLGLTTREVLVERFVEGEPMLNFVLKEDEYHSKKDRRELATIGLETVMKMIFLHDFVHADLVGCVLSSLLLSLPCMS